MQWLEWISSSLEAVCTCMYTCTCARTHTYKVVLYTVSTDISNFLTCPSSLHQKLPLSLSDGSHPSYHLALRNLVRTCFAKWLTYPIQLYYVLTLLTQMTPIHCLLSDWEAVCSLPKFQEIPIKLSQNSHFISVLCNNRTYRSTGWGSWVMPISLFCPIPLWLFLFGAFERQFEGKGKCHYTLCEFD